MANSQSLRKAVAARTTGELPCNDLFLASQELAPVGFTILRAVRAPGGTVIDFEWEYANPAALRALKVSDETLIGRRLLERLPGNRDHPQLFPRYVRTIETREPSEVELTYTSEGMDGVYRNAVSCMGPDLIGVWFEDVTERVRSEQNLRNRMAEIEALYQHAPVGLALFDPDLNFVRINDTLADMNGRPASAHIGRWAWDIVPSLRESVEPKLQEVLATGSVVETEVSGETPKVPGLTRWWHEKYYPLYGKNGAVSAVGAVVEEITERKAAENILKLSAMELRHRIKNLISVVGCLANQTFQGSELADRRRDFEGRLRAIDQANSVLGDEAAWWASELTALVGIMFEGKVLADRFTFDGPPVKLAPRVTTALSMTLHELATNAMKYGALRTPDGRLALSWIYDSSTSSVELHWRELGGPQVEPPAKGGFGSRMIQQMIAAEGGTVDLQYLREGVHCTLRFNPRGANAEGHSLPV
jgi:two-component system CheB/CheR fusion protein